MAEWLIIRLPRGPGAGASWIVADTAGRIAVPVHEGPLAEAAALAGGRRVAVLVPAVDVVLTEVDIPLRSGARAQQIVPFALEEQLAEDVESLHFAVGRRAESSRTPVAVVSRGLLEEWLARLRQAGIAPDSLHSESELLPVNPGQAVALLDADCAIVRPPGRLPIAMPIDALAEALELGRPVQEPLDAPADRPGHGLVLYTGAAEWHRHSAEVEAVRDRFDGIKIQLLTEGPLPLYAQRIAAAAAGGIDLLQGPYAPVTAHRPGWKAWRVAAVLLGALVLLHAASSAARLLTLSAAEHRTDAAIVRTFRAAMPGEHDAIDARRRMQQRLQSLHGSGSGSGLLAALDAVAAAQAGTQGTSLRALSYRGGSLELTIAAPNPEVLDHLSTKLRAQGWRANLIAGNTVGTHYEGRVEIKPGA